MPRCLLVDTNRAAYPIFQALRKLGYEVWVVGRNPEEPLARLSKNYKNLDYSDADQLAAYVRQEKFDFIIPGCTDLSYSVCAEVSRGNYPGIDLLETTNAINIKSSFRALARELNVPIPKVISEHDALGGESVIVKPVDSFSGRGVEVLHRPSPAVLKCAIDQARELSSNGDVLIEEFIEGQLYSYSAFLENGDVKIGFVVREDCSVNPFAVDTSQIDFAFPRKILRKLEDWIRRISRSLGVCSGLLHTQFILRGEEVFLIEMTRRCPGDLYSLLVEYSTGYDYALAYVSSFIGRSLPEYDQKRFGRCSIVRHTVTSKKEAPLIGFVFSKSVNIRLLVPLCVMGETIQAGPAGRASILFLEADSDAEAQSLYQDLVSGNLYEFN